MACKPISWPPTKYKLIKQAHSKSLTAEHTDKDTQKGTVPLISWKASPKIGQSHQFIKGSDEAQFKIYVPTKTTAFSTNF